MEKDNVRDREATPSNTTAVNEKKNWKHIPRTLIIKHFKVI